MPQTDRKLAEIRAYPLLSRVGTFAEKASVGSFPALGVPTWDAFCRHLDDESLWLKMHSRLNTLIHGRIAEGKRRGSLPWKAKDFTLWCRLVRPLSKAFVLDACDALQVTPAQKTPCAGSLNWMVDQVIIATQAEEVTGVIPAIAALDEVLRSGHVVAGWKGRYPKGGLLVF